MAGFDRKSLREIFENADMEVPPKDVLGKICDLHETASNGMAETIKDLQGKLRTAVEEKSEPPKAEAKEDETDYKSLYEQLQKDVKADKAKAAKETAYRALLKEAGVSEKRIDAVLKVSAVDGVELDKDGQIKGKGKLIESVKAEWADFITTTTTTGAQTPNPPANNGGGLKTLDEIYKTDEKGRFVYDATQRQQARAEILAAQQQKG